MRERGCEGERGCKGGDTQLYYPIQLTALMQYLFYLMSHFYVHSYLLFSYTHTCIS